MRDYLNNELIEEVLSLEGDLFDRQKNIFDKYIDIPRNDYSDLIGLVKQEDGSETLCFMHTRKVIERIEFKRQPGEKWEEVEYKKAISKLDE